MTLAQRFEQRGLPQGDQSVIAKKRLAKGANVSDIEEHTELSYQELVSRRLT